MEFGAIGDENFFDVALIDGHVETYAELSRYMPLPLELWTPSRPPLADINAVAVNPSLEATKPAPVVDAADGQENRPPWEFAAVSRKHIGGVQPPLTPQLLRPDIGELRARDYGEFDAGHLAVNAFDVGHEQLAFAEPMEFVAHAVSRVAQDAPTPFFASLDRGITPQLICAQRVGANGVRRTYRSVDREQFKHLLSQLSRWRRLHNDGSRKGSVRARPSTSIEHTGDADVVTAVSFTFTAKFGRIVPQQPVRQKRVRVTFPTVGEGNDVLVARVEYLPVPQGTPRRRAPSADFQHTPQQGTPPVGASQSVSRHGPPSTSASHNTPRHVTSPVVRGKHVRRELSFSMR